jgi:hypothetical protein
MDLDRTLANLEYTRGTWEGYLQEYGLIGQENQNREIVGSKDTTTTTSTWKSLNWLKKWTP